MNEHEKMLIKACKVMCNVGSMCYDYTWSQEFCKKEMSNTIQEIKEYFTEHNFDICKCSIDILKAVGFVQWDDNENALLIPLWAALILDENTPVICINGESDILKNADHDVRCGCIAYMINVKEDKNE